jgi:hypothetical protein
LQEDETQPGTKAGITSGERGSAVADGGVPPQLEGGGIHRGVAKHSLTLVATGHNAGVGEERWSVLVGVEGDEGAVQRKQRKKVCGDDLVRLPPREWLRLCGDDGSTAGLPRLLRLLSLLLDVTGGGLGRGIPNWLGLASGARGASCRLGVGRADD